MVLVYMESEKQKYGIRCENNLEVYVEPCNWSHSGKVFEDFWNLPDEERGRLLFIITMQMLVSHT